MQSTNVHFTPTAYRNARRGLSGEESPSFLGDFVNPSFGSSLWQVHGMLSTGPGPGEAARSRRTYRLSCSFQGNERRRKDNEQANGQPRILSPGYRALLAPHGRQPQMTAFLTPWPPTLVLAPCTVSQPPTDITPPHAFICKPSNSEAIVPLHTVSSFTTIMLKHGSPQWSIQTSVFYVSQVTLPRCRIAKDQPR